MLPMCAGEPLQVARQGRGDVDVGSRDRMRERIRAACRKMRFQPELAQLVVELKSPYLPSRARMPRCAGGRGLWARPVKARLREG